MSLYKIKPRRPTQASLPASADAGELIITSDTHQIYTGEGDGNPLAAVGGGGVTSPIQLATIDLSADDLLGSDNNIPGNLPFQVIAAPPSGQAIIILNALITGASGNTFQETNVTNLYYFESPNTPISYFSGISAQQGCLEPNAATLFSEIPAGFQNAQLNISGLPLAIECPCAAGSIASSSLGSSGGNGYAPGDDGQVGAGDSSAAYLVDTVDGNGAVLTYHLTSNGEDCYPTVNCPTSVNNGNGDGGFQITINTVTPGTGSAKLTIVYYIAPLA